ncbi:MAG: glycosyltransferase family 87 protein [Desulfobaccales bacterium]
MNHKSIYWYFRLLLVSHLVILGAFYLVIGCYAAAGTFSKTDLVDLSGRPLGSDFLCFWAASEVAKTQGPAAVFSRESMAAAEREVIRAETSPKFWNYPPTFLLMILPLSLLPYAVSFVCWLAVTGSGFVCVVRRLIPQSPLSWLVLVFPATVHNFLYGQNGFLSAAFLGGGLLLVARYPFAGGCLLGLLSYKPQLAWLTFIALAAGRYWKALIGAAISAAGLALVSLWVLGSNVWIAFFQNLPLAANLLDRLDFWGKMPTVFAAARLWGASQELAAAIQAVATLGGILVVGWVWFRRLPLPIRGSVLAVGIFLTTPYAFDYDLAILALPFAWLGWQAYDQDSKFQQVFLLLAWCLLAWGSLRTPWVSPWAMNFPFRLAVLLALLFLALYRGARPLSGSRAQG